MAHPLRHELQALLRTAPRRHLDLLSALKATSRGALYAEQAILFRRLGNHRSALTVLAVFLRDFRAAEEYCAETDVGSSHGDDGGCYIMLLDMYLNPMHHYRAQRRRQRMLAKKASHELVGSVGSDDGEGEEGEEDARGAADCDDADAPLCAMEPMYEPAIALLSSRGARQFLNPLTILQALSTSNVGARGGGGPAPGARRAGSDAAGAGGDAPGSSPPLHIVSALLVRILREHNHKTMEARMVKAMEKRINLDAACRRQALHRQRVVMTEQVACGACGAPLGNKTVFVKFPESAGANSGSLMCYKCWARSGGGGGGGG